MCAVMVMLNVPASVVVPLSVAVPFPLSWKVMPLGSAAPPSFKLGVGKPVDVTVNNPATPTINVALFPLVIAAD